jgi:phosphate acetyltransferase
MNKAIHCNKREQNSGKSIITLGLMSMLIGKMAKVGYFRPIIEDFEEGGFDNHIETVIGHFGMDIEFEDAYAITKSKLIKRKTREIGEVLDLVLKI